MNILRNLCGSRPVHYEPLSDNRKLQGRNCGVCLDDLSNSEHPVLAHTRGGDKHPTHKPCLQNVVTHTTSWRQPQCPTCRTSFDPNSLLSFEEKEIALNEQCAANERILQERIAILRRFAADGVATRAELISLRIGLVADKIFSILDKTFAILDKAMPWFIYFPEVAGTLIGLIYTDSICGGLVSSIFTNLIVTKLCHTPGTKIPQEKKELIKRLGIVKIGVVSGIAATGGVLGGPLAVRSVLKITKRLLSPSGIVENMVKKYESPLIISSLIGGGLLASRIASRLLQAVSNRQHPNNN